MKHKPNKPKSAYMFWLDNVREKMITENPSVKVMTIIKGEKLWHEMEDKSVWQEKAAKAKAQYEKELEAYNAENCIGQTNSIYDQSNSSSESMDDIQYTSEEDEFIPEEVTDKPKGPMSAYMFWLDSVQEQMIAENPGVNPRVSDIINKGQTLWHGMVDKSAWEVKAAKAKAQYEKELEAYNGKRIRPTDSIHDQSNSSSESMDDIQYTDEGNQCIPEEVTDKPKRPMSAYMIWLDGAREQIKAENTGLKATEIAKKGGEIWRSMKDKHVWEEKAAKAKAQYEKELEAYNAENGIGLTHSLNDQSNSGSESMDDIYLYTTEDNQCIPEEVTDKPKRPMSAYMIWLNNAREQIKAENPGLKVTEIAKKGGEIWRAMKNRHVWEDKAAKAKAQYEKELEAYKAMLTN